MKIKTTVSLSTKLLEALAAWPEAARNRSVFLETATWAYLTKMQREQINTRDMATINHHADYLNAEVEDALNYQVSILKPET